VVELADTTDLKSVEH